MNKVVNDTLPVVATPATLLAMAVEQNADIDKLSKLMDLQERWEAKEAKKSYVSALAKFSADVPAILKTKDAHKTKYAGLAETLTVIKPDMAANGLSHAWITSQDGPQITVRCIVTHIMGHSEETSLSSGSDTSGSKNDIQAIGSTVKYLERYTLYAILGLASADDDDGNAAGGKVVELITDEQLLNLEGIISDNYEPAGAEALKKWVFSTLKISALAEIRADRVDWLIGEIDKAIASRNKT
jgi:hypothetical protein